MDQLVKRRAKSGLIRVKVDWSGAQEFVTQYLDKEIKVNIVRSFIIYTYSVAKENLDFLVYYSYHKKV